MTSETISWSLVDQIAIELGANEPARRKWRQRGVPPAWQIKIVERLMAIGTPIALSDFRRLELTSDRVAA